MFSNPDTPLFILAALTGGIAGRLATIPGGPLLASSIAVASVGMYWDLSHSPLPEMVLLLQILTGTLLGQSINRRFWQDLAHIWKPTLVVVLTFTALSVPFVFLLVLYWDFDPLTAVLASTPARMQDMIVLAGSLNTDAVTVMLMQLARQFAIIGLTPLVLAQFGRDEKAAKATAAEPRKCLGMPDFRHADAESFLILMVPGIAGAVIGRATGHILGALLGAFLFVAVSRILWLRAGEIPFPRPFTFIIQCLAGILLGSRITPETGSLLLERLFPFVASCLYVVAAGIIISHILHKHYHWHKALSWLSSSPGRTADMLAMAQDIDLTGRDRLALVSVHAVRQVYFTLLVSIVMVFL